MDEVYNFTSGLPMREKIENLKKIGIKDLSLIPPSSSREVQKSNEDFITSMVTRGFTPKWYVVFHLNNTTDKLESSRFQKNLNHIKNKLFSELYGSRWKKKKSIVRTLWSTEFGKFGTRPHLNLLIEKLPYPYDEYRSVDILFNRLLPRLCKCIWINSTEVQPVDIDTSRQLYSYICKESNFTNSTIDYLLTDKII